MFYQEKAKEIVQKLSLKQKVGQLFLLAFPGKDPEKIRLLIEEYNIGGIYISQDNIETPKEAQKLTRILQSYTQVIPTPVPLLIGADQEGTWSVMYPNMITGPGNLALGAAGELDITADIYQIYGQDMLSCGINAILAPVADINLSSDTPIIGPRSFGEDPNTVAQHVKSAIRGAKKTGIITAAKHFPGHGSTKEDTHRDIPIIDKSLTVLLKEDLYPFKCAIESGVDLMMTSHIIQTQIDPDNMVTFSPIILKNILRDMLGFKGLIISDSMNMGAIRKYYTPGESVIKALNAGVDIIMLSEEHYDHSDHYYTKQIDSLENIINAVKSRQINMIQFDRIVEKIVAFKLEKIKKVPLVEIANTEKLRIESTAAEKAVTCVINYNRQWPVSQDQEFICINATPKSSYQNLINQRGIGPNQSVPASTSFFNQLKLLANKCTVLDYQSACHQQNYPLLQESETIVVLTEDYPLPGEDFDKSDQQKLVRNLIDTYAHKLIVLGLRSGYEVNQYPGIQCYISTFSSRNCAAIAAAKALLGEIPTVGISPVTLDVT
jgi:beta-N-acetylhexosaminidase